MTYGLYEVTENHTFRGLEAGTQFEARTDRGAEARAVGRGVIRLIEVLTPALVAESYVFPQGWLSSHNESDNRAPEGALSLRRE